jgi:hypothetical protein
VRLALTIAAALALAPVLGTAACSSTASAVGQGGACSTATDCAEGLVCVPQKDGSRICTNNLNGVDQTPTLPSRDAGTEDTGAVADDAPEGIIPDATAPTSD